VTTASSLLARWRSTGWVHLPGFFEPSRLAEIDGWVSELERTAAEDATVGLHHYEATPAGPRLARSEDFVDFAGFGELLTDGPIAELATVLFSEPARLFKEKINYKYPGGGGYAPHQDAAAYRFDADVVDTRHLSIMVALDPATIRSGCLWVGEGRVSELLPGDGRGRLAPHVVDAITWLPIEVGAGDVVCFDSFVPHKSGTNDASTARRAMYLTYNPASEGNLRARYYDAKRRTFGAAGDRYDDVGGQARVRLSLSDDFLGTPVTPR
jgi:hypothetical protein